MKINLGILLSICLLSMVGCETMEQGAYKAGEGVGKATRVGDKVAEGAVDGYMGKEDPRDNPYGR